ncbi:mitochondrial carrier domain-containing protein [Infundibulicybe gibba]|nr:mitochondrial carrier domain-containing protein [Infundibulicybe gibba]
MNSSTADGHSGAGGGMSSSVRDAIKDIAFGSFAGMVAEGFEYPFDLAKVRLQAQLLLLNPNVEGEGFQGLYRGVSAPLVGSTIGTAAIFVSYSSFQNLIRWNDWTPNKSRHLSVPELTLAAAAAGFFTSFIITPIELVKCKMQVQMMNPLSNPGLIQKGSSKSLSSFPLPFPAAARSSYNYFTPLHQLSEPVPKQNFQNHLPGPISIIRSTIQTHGMRGLWTGHTGTIFRDTGSSAAWFGAKEWVASMLLARRSNPKENKLSSGPTLVPWESAFAGAVAGAAGCLAVYPADTVKSAMQTEEELLPKGSVSKRPSTFWSTSKRMYTNHGVRGCMLDVG